MPIDSNVKCTCRTAMASFARETATKRRAITHTCIILMYIQRVSENTQKKGEKFFISFYFFISDRLRYMTF